MGSNDTSSTLRWFTVAEVKAMPSDVRYDVQAITFLVEIPRVFSEIPVAPEVAMPANGPMSAAVKWYGTINGRLFTIETQSTFPEDTLSSVILFTPFTDQVGTDWDVIHELRGLPPSIHVSRPGSIQSRTPQCNHVVYRPDGRGWRIPIYRAWSLRDAQCLLEYLTQDDWNAGCFIGEPDIDGDWTIFQSANGVKKGIGNYTSSDSAFSLAYQASEKNPGTEVTVRHFPIGFAPREYSVVGGRVAGA